MNTYEVTVVASYAPETDLLRIFAAFPKAPDGTVALDTTGADWTIGTSVLVDPPLQTLTVLYADAEGRDPDEARRFALAIFEHERQRLGIPEPETVVANID